MGARLGKAFYVRLNLTDEKPNVPRPMAAAQPVKATGAVAVPRDQASAEGKPRASVPSRAQDANERPILVLRDDEAIVGDARPAQPIAGLRTDGPPSASGTRLRTHRTDFDDSIIDGRFGAMVAAALMASFAFAAVLPWMLTRTVDSAAAPIIVSTPVPEPSVPIQTATTPAAAPVANPGAVPTAVTARPAPAVIQPPPAARAAPVNATKSVVQTDKQPAARTAQVRPVVSSAGNGPSRAALSPEEKLAVDRGRQALGDTATRAAPRRAAPSRAGLSEEERAAVERGLRELEKAQ